MKTIIRNDFNFKGEMKELLPKNVILVILHHRAGEGDVQSIHQQHVKRGWSGIGYHFYIKKDGDIFAGRPTNFIGAHCNGNNSKSLGVCLEGDFRKEQPTAEQVKSLNELITHLKEKFPTLKRVLNHKDLYATACPVVDLKSMVKVDGVSTKAGV